MEGSNPKSRKGQVSASKVCRVQRDRALEALHNIKTMVDTNPKCHQLTTEGGVNDLLADINEQCAQGTATVTKEAAAAA